VRYIWGHAYSDEEEVVTYVAKMMLVIAVSNFFDGIQCVLSGVARGCGWQKIGACVNLGAYYIVGIPSAYLIAFVLHVGGMVLTEEPSRSFVCLNFHQVPCCKLFLVDVMSFNNAECLIGSMARHHLRPLGASPATNGNNTMHKLG
jgi:hypothetical protein